MFPILYDHIERDESAVIAPKFIVPANKGLGTLSDCSSCYVEQERNSIYELTMEYPANGIHANEFARRRIIKAKPNFTDDPQLFRIDRIGKTMSNGNFTVYAKHISYDISGYVISNGNAINAVNACALLRDATNKDFNIHTNKDVVANFVITEPSSVRSWFVGKTGSFLDVYGTAELKYDNFDVNFMLHAGVTEPREFIRYGKNLLELSQEIDCSNLYTHVLCYYKGEGGVVSSDKIATGLVLDVDRCFVFDATSDFEEVPTKEMLNARALRYKNENNLTTPSDNITLDFVQSGELTGRVDLCDIVSIHYDALGINTEMKCIRTKWDVLREKYVETEFGDAKKTLVETIGQVNSIAVSAQDSVESAVTAVKSKKRVFINEPVPPYDRGDLWVDGENIRYCAEPKTANEEYELSDWLLASDYMTESAMDAAIKTASQLITGGLGGNIIIMRNEITGKPYELVISDNPVLENAVHVWRWNIDGLAYSSDGYDPQKFTTAITSDGKIVADFITTGTLHAGDITVMGLKASMFEGQEIDLGGPQNPEGVLKILDRSGNPLVVMNSNGIECFGEAVNGITPSVVFDKYGMTGYSNKDDKQNSAIFWTKKDDFCMKNGIVENQLSVGKKLKMVPFTIKDGNGNIVNDGIAEIPVV